MPATYAQHLRLSMIGDLPSGEMFSCNLALVPSGAGWADQLLADVWNGPDMPGGADEWAQRWPDTVNDVVSFWGRGSSHISSRAVLKRVKLAPIKANGEYAGIPFETAVNMPGSSGEGEEAPGGPATDMLPFQIARKVTFETDADLGRIKGGFYLPGVRSYGFDPGSNLTSQEVTAAVRGSVEALVEAINNAPGVDGGFSYVVVVASQGRRTNGVLRVPPGNHVVKRINVGRRVDVIRRRANKISEARISDAEVANP